MAENLVKLLEGMVADLDTSYSEILKFADPLDYTVASGIWLDYIGTIVGEDPRVWDTQTNTPLTSDEEYRKLIGVKISLNAGSGTTEDIIMAVRRYALMGSGEWDDVKDIPFMLTQHGANVFVETVNGNVLTAFRIKEYASAGVGIYIASITSTPFAFSSLDPNYVPGTGPMGFSNLSSPTDGGNFKFFLSYKE